MEFNLAEKLAIVKMIDSVIYADGVVHKGEINEVSLLMKRIDFDSSFIHFARNIESSQGLVILKDMTDEKKKALARILEDVAKSDGFVHEKEAELLTNIFSAIGVDYKLV